MNAVFGSWDQIIKKVPDVGQHLEEICFTLQSRNLVSLETPTSVQRFKNTNH